MCELFGFSAGKAYDTTSWLKEFFSHSPMHPDGWGLATFPCNTVSIEKEPVCANDSAYLGHRLADPIVGKLVLAHIRKASVGSLRYANCHPFALLDAGGRCWTLIHNGTIFQSDALESYVSAQHGSTDSERILLHLVSAVNRLEGRMLCKANAKERFDAIEAAIAEIAPGNKVNLILYDGELFYIHSNMASFLWFLQLPDAVVVSTKPLSGGHWAEVPTSTLIAFCEGIEQLRGRDMRHPYTGEIPADTMQPGLTALFGGYGI